ncbi:MAG: HK97 family phage prohead protease [Bdellovibrionaceae bacterium]|nr:HK97 family phage prohead protease [Pseudobdellovibrionaceae bacterium]
MHRKLESGSLRASLEPSREKREATLRWTTGQAGLRHGLFGPYYEELAVDEKAVDMSRLAQGAPLLDSHNGSSIKNVIGSVVRAWLANGEGHAVVRFADTPEGEAAYRQVKSGAVSAVSVGYKIDPEGVRDVSAEGDKIPTLRITRWQPFEISLVPVGFDSEARVTEVRNHPASGQKKDSVLDKARLEKQIREAELARCNQIRSIVSEHGLDSKLADEYIANGSTVDAVRTNAAMFAKYQQAPVVDNTTRIEVGTEDRDKKRICVVDALAFRVCPDVGLTNQGRQYAGYSFLRSLEAVIHRPLGMTDASFARAAMSSSDLPYILANVAEKAAQARYDLQEPTWKQWANARTLRNFKTHDQVRSGNFPSLEERQENGEFRSGSFGEEREQVALKEWGKMLSFTRRMLINDDLDEIRKVTDAAGIAASRLENSQVYGALTGNAAMGDGFNMFDNTNHLNDPTGAALSDTSLAGMSKALRNQRGVDSLDRLNLKPRHLICGPDQEATALKYLTQLSPNSVSDVNIALAMQLQLIVDAEITTNDYYMACDKSQCDGIVLFRLEGEEKPRVESRVNFETEAVDLKVAHSCIAKAMDYRGLVRNVNAS